MVSSWGNNEWILTRSLESSGIQPSSAKTNVQSGVLPIAFLVDGKHVVSGSNEGTIRRWRVEDSMEVGAPMDAGSAVLNIAVSRNGKWIVSGTGGGQVQVWNAESGEKVTEIRGHSYWVDAVDVSPDSTKIASGSYDTTACIWSLPAGQRLLGPWKHSDDVVFAVKFSHDGRLTATATWKSTSIYDSQSGNLVVNVPIGVAPSCNHSLAWSSNTKHLFAVSSGKIIYLDASTGATLSQWSIHGDKHNRIALASDGAFIAASSHSSVSFWDATTHKGIRSAIEHSDRVECMAVSANHDIVISDGKKIMFHNLCNILPSSYCDNVSTFESRRYAAQ